MIRIILFFFVLTSYTHAQSANITPYIQGKDVGLQINPMITGVRSSVSNQETELNITFFYHDNYDLRENETLGVIEGRLISEIPLSSFDFLKKIREDNSLVISNYAEQNRIYQEALSNFQTFQEQNNSEEYYYYYDEEETPEELENNEIPDVDNLLGGLSQKHLNLKAENILSNRSLDSVSETISDKELEYLIRLEILKKQYDQVVKQYNEMISNTNYNDEFDPGDPAESFTIVILGEDLTSLWTKEFGLDGVSNYQSYNDRVWYLGYRIPITKKDIRLLYNIFTKNEKIQYIVKGSGGTASFNLSSHFIQAVHELVTLYARGKLKRDQETVFPILRNNENEPF
ncbi:MAG: hypothetical protein ACRCWI_01590 [Brevinema sp.]